MAISYFVSPTGDDGNLGTITRPWRTLQRAADMVAPGDTVYLRGGIYHQYVDLNISGAPGQYITFRVVPGETAVLDGLGAGWDYGFNLHDYVSHIRIEGLKITSFPGCGLTLCDGNTHAEIRNVEISNCGTGLRIHNGDDLLVEDCYIHHNGAGLIIAPGPVHGVRILRTRAFHNRGGSWSQGFAVEAGSGILFQGCLAEENEGDGFNSRVPRTTLSGCLSRDNGGNGFALAERHCRMENCIADGNGLAGIALAAGGSYALINNLVTNCASQGDCALEVGGDAGPAGTRLWLTNNIFAFNNGGVHFGPGVVFDREDNNIYWRENRLDVEITLDRADGRTCFSSGDIVAGKWTAATGQGQHSISADPQFADPVAHNFRLALGSPGIDAGTAEQAPAVDIEGQPRPRGKGCDIGPYEAQSAVATAPPPELPRAGALQSAAPAIGPVAPANLNVPVTRRVEHPSGPAAGGTRVFIVGFNFQDGATVLYGDRPAQSVKWVSPRRLETVTPPHPSGAVQVTVINPDGGTSTPAPQSRFTFARSPRQR